MNSEVKAERWFLLAWGLISLWILACAFMVKGEYGDGYQTIANGRSFFADTAGYYVQRGPLAAFAMGPVELFRAFVHWDATDVRPYHIYSGLLHSLYLLGCWLLLKRSGSDQRAQFLAFAAAILSVVFYANAPHLSHDIIPGLLFLLLIHICNRWLDSPTRKLALQLILLGAAVTLIKQTYALFWCALVAYALIAYAMKWDNARVSGQRVVALFGLAAASAIISWFGYGLVVANEWPGVSILGGPLALISVVSGQYGGTFETVFTTDLYLRNVHNYGIAAMLLVLPGIVLAFRGSDARIRLVAVCWIVSVIALQMVSFREVRYLAFLAPLTAVLIVPVIHLLMRQPVALGLLIAVITFDQYRGLSVSAAQLSSTGGVDIDRFIAAPEGDGRVVFSDNLSFIYMPASPMLRDPYHGIYHISGPLFDRLNENRIEVVNIDDPRDLGIAGIVAGDRLFYSNITVLRSTPWADDNVPATLKELVMIAGDAMTVTLRRDGDSYLVDGADSRFFMLVPSAKQGQQMPILSSGSYPAEEIQRLYGDRGQHEELTVIGIAVKALCQADICRYE
jgi:hypothetical protein